MDITASTSSISQSHIIPQIPSRGVIEKFILLVGHNCLAKHLHRIEMID
jgi:hypothetical protein